MMGSSDARSVADFSFVSRNNCSLSSSGRWIGLGIGAVFCVGASVGLFFFLGAWPILPFMGAELFVLCAAFWYINRHIDDGEIISAHENTLIVEVIRGRKTKRLELDRYWTRIELCRNRESNKVQVLLRSRGKEILLGSHLPQAERIEFGKKLNRIFSN